MSITDFLLARIAEDESKAWSEMGSLSRDAWPGECSARVLAECAAKRAIVELAEAANQSDAELDYKAGMMQPLTPHTGDSILHALAAVYADHPAYLDEWRVGV